MSRSLASRLYGSLVDLSFLYKTFIPSQRGRWRLLKLLRRFEPADFAPGVVRRDGRPWHIGDLKNDVEAALYYGLPYDADTLSIIEALVEPGDVVIDIGANVGLITLLLSRLVGDTGRVLAFEASPIHFRSLERNINLQRVGNCFPQCIALADSDGECVHYTTHSSGSLVSDFSEFGFECVGTTKVRTKRLDDVLSTDERSRISFVKLDVDGNEMAVLRGASQTLQESKPNLLVEVSERTQAKAGSSARMLLNCLSEFGYSFRIGRDMVSIDGEEILQSGAASADVLCVHASRVDQRVESLDKTARAATLGSSH
jgi:FkbM family methyltransferase